MRAVCTVLLIGCGFHSPGGTDNPDAAPDGPPTDGDAMLCASIMAGNPQFSVSACAPTPSSLDITTSVTLDTTAGTSNQPGLACAATSTTLCIVAAPAITIASGGTLIARGARPLALLARAITIRGTVDVASHYNAPPGAGSRPDGCTFGSLAKGAGGGRGGHSGGAGGGVGGDEALLSGTGGHGGGTFQVVALLGGCGGTRGGDGTLAPGSPDVSDGGNATGGAGGGAVWLASDPGPLILGSTAVINASGASGAGASVPGHGGAGGGAGGLIVLQAATIQLDPAAQIFANGGPGGGGAGINLTGTGYLAGQPGTDPDGPASGGSPGAGGVDGATSIAASTGIVAGTSPGDGAAGFPATTRNGQSGGTTAGRGGGGGGGGAGAIRVVSTSNVTSTNISPPPLRLP